MIGRLSLVRLSGRSVRQLSGSASLKQLPSSGEMKSEKLWSGSGEESETNSSSDSAIFRVVQSAKNMQNESALEPPVEILPQHTPRFNEGTFYDPFLFSLTKTKMENSNRSASSKKVTDPFQRAGINPLDLYTMPEILSRFLSSTGQILPRSVTGCNGANQKKLGIAIQRARLMGLLSTVHRHSRYMPERNL